MKFTKIGNITGEINKVQIDFLEGNEVFYVMSDHFNVNQQRAIEVVHNVGFDEFDVRNTYMIVLTQQGEDEVSYFIQGECQDTVHLLGEYIALSISND